MKLGISYNVFDGEELLEGSIRQIRNQVDYVSVVYQKISNFGRECNKNLIDNLNKLKQEGLVDRLYCFNPIIQNGPAYNEVSKRNAGLILSEIEGCTHHMSMDCDEYYIGSEFEKIKKIIVENDYDSSYCQMQTYYKSWEYKLSPPEEYYVSLIFKIKKDSKYIHAYPSPVEVDPTRRMSEMTNPIIFTRDQIEMHHGSYIRNDIRTKFENSSSKNNNWNIDKVVDYYNNWKELEDGLLLKPSFEEKVRLKKINKLF
jgi:hypothetical protein